MVLLCSRAVAALLPITAQAQIICVSNVSPPPDIPVYEQPPIPAAGYLWIPGYWASGPNGYFWVPGTWVLPPAAGLFWTPGYWAWRDGIYVWNAGYWGPHVGFYGGINYGFGYVGFGYEGGRWESGVFAYNRAVNNLGAVAVARVYDKPVIVAAGRVSFNGGAGGTTVRPTAEEEAAAHEQHVAALAAQFAHERVASASKALLASENHGRPAIAATVKPGEFTGKGVVAAREVAPGAVIPTAKPSAVEVSPHPLEPRPLPKEERPGERPVPLNAAIPPQPPITEQKLPPRELERKPPPPATAAVKPATPPVRPTVPVQAVAKPLPPSSPRPVTPAGKPACPPGKVPVEVNGHPTCKWSAR